MNLKEPSRKKRVRQQPQRPFPIPLNKNDEWVMYTAHLSASGTCIAHPEEMAAVYCMGSFGKGSLSRGFPSFGKRRFGAPPQVKERQWKRRKRWLEDVRKLEAEPFLFSAEASNKVDDDDESMKPSSVASEPPEGVTDPEGSGNATESAEKASEVIEDEEKPSKDEENSAEGDLAPETSGGSSKSIDEVPEITKNDEKEEETSKTEEDSPGFGGKCEKKTSESLEKSKIITNSSIIDEKTEENKTLMTTDDEVAAPDPETPENSHLDPKNPPESPKKDQENGSGALEPAEDPAPVEISPKTDEKNPENESSVPKTDDQPPPESEDPENSLKSNRKLEENQAEAPDNRSPVVRSLETDGELPAEASPAPKTSERPSEKIPQARKNQREIDEVVLDSTEDEEVLEIIDPSKSMETESQGDDICVLNDEMEGSLKPDNFQDFMQLPQEKTKVNPNEMLVLPDSDSDTESYLKTIDPRLETEGFPVAETLQLTFEETFFLMYGLGCLQVVNYEGQFFSIIEAWRHFNEQDEGFFSRYVVYHYFRSKGWVVKPGLKCSGDFVLYKKGPQFYHASYIVFIEVVDADSLLRDDSKMKRDSSWLNIHCLNRLAQSVAKELLIVQVLWPSTVPRSSSPVPLEALSEFTVRELLIRRWNPNETCEPIPLDDDEDEDSEDDDSS
ncbi:probable tRNA-splicing endonuclease subunit tsp-2 [Diachasma alloeum]|uniref:probable tRNA-splicing endonuclease subunit tsp-2 n=1 Tax=Diachasma alloeum TaxID=454923 RepID=UPI0007384ACE|nr:probable tRNA-splicing endonuclease subunit tsp-2 [Diachasma alloeum]XP_015126915.1 probable tRNA-splicing endonuclease subunit tsp-2 [Diachasma alloeum]XP_015126917.1 probable tRNA-splicing endonuclease subunit tsp-2 [Diachasma alloeum]